MSRAERQSMLILLLMVAGFLLLVLAAFNVNSPKLSLGWAGLACWCLATMLTSGVGHLLR